MNAEGALVGLLREEDEELVFPGACYEDKAVQERMKSIRFHLDEVAAGRVIRTGEPQIVTDMTEDQRLYPNRDAKLGYATRSFIEVPLRSSDRIIGVLCAINKKSGTFEAKDIELLSLIGGTVALSIENARFSEELKKSYLEVRSLNQAKDKAINHLSHELKTPLSVLVGSMDILSKKLEGVPAESWTSTMERTRRNLNRIVEIQDEVDDIIQGKRPEAMNVMTTLLDHCMDELETLLVRETGDESGVERIRRRIEEIYGARDLVPEPVTPGSVHSRAPQSACGRVRPPGAGASRGSRARGRGLHPSGAHPEGGGRAGAKRRGEHPGRRPHSHRPSLRRGRDRVRGAR